MRALFFVLLLGASAIGCSTNTPSAPTPAPRPPVSPLPLPRPIAGISMVGNQWILLGSDPVQITARLLTGTGETFDGAEYVTWSLEPDGIVTIDKQGRLTPRSPGSVTVTAAAGGQTGRLTVRVLPDHAGRWAGESIVTACSGFTDFRTCSNLRFDSSGLRRYPLAAILAQDRDQVTGTLQWTDSTGLVQYPVSGAVALNGMLMLEGSLPNPGLEPHRVSNWSSEITGTPPRLSGGFTTTGQGVSTFGIRYNYRVEYEFTGLSVTRP